MPQYVGSVMVDVKFDSTRATTGLKTTLGKSGDEAAAAVNKSMSTRLQGVSTQLGEIANKGTRAGRQLTFGLTVPMVAFGKSAVDSFTGFDTAMTRINSLVGINKNVTDEWRGQVVDLGNEFGLTAKEVAEGLYFITSSGIEGSQAMEVLRVASMGAAVGLGSVQSVADVLTSAMNAYGSSNLTAAQAGDILTIAVREGKAEADQMATSLGRVIPIASSMGISFQEVAGMASALTLTGNSAEEAATQITAILSQLADLPPISQRALKAYTGIEYGQLRLDLKSKGLRQTLQEVTGAFHGNETAMAEVFGNIRALRGVMGTFGQTADQTTDIITKMNTETGTLAKAWEQTAQSPAKQLEVAMANLKNSMVDIGASLVPVFTTVAGVAGALVTVFSALPGPIKNVAIGFGVLAAAAGPLVYSVSALANVARIGVGALTKMLPSTNALTNNMQSLWIRMDQGTKSGQGFIGKMGGMGQVMGAAGVAVGAAVAIYAIWNTRMEESKRLAGEVGMAFKKSASKGGIGAAQDTIGKTRKEIEGLNQQLNESSQLAFWDEDYRNDIRMSKEELERNIAATEKQIDMSAAMGRSLNMSQDALFNWLTTERAAGREYGNSAEAVDAYRRALGKGDAAAVEAQQTSNALANSFSALAGKVKESSDAFFGAYDAEKKVAQAREAIVTAREKVVDAEDAYADAQRKAVDAARKVQDAERKATDSSNKLADARTTLADAQRELNDVMRGPSEDEQINVESAEISLQEAQDRLRTGKFETPLERRRAQLDVRRAVIDLARTRAEHAQKVKDAEDNVAQAVEGVQGAEQSLEDAQRSVEDARQARLEADEATGKARDHIKTATDDVAEAENNLIKPAMDAAIAQSSLSDMLAAGTFNALGMIGQLSSLQDMYPELAGALKPYVDKLWEMVSAQNQMKNLAPPNSPVPNVEDRGNAFQLRAIGGPVTAGSLYRVNERKVPELFESGGRQFLMPLTNGSITPMPNIPVRGGDGVTVGDIHVYGQTEPLATAYEVRRQLRAKPRMVARRG